MPFFRKLIYAWTGYDRVKWLEHSMPEQTADHFNVCSDHVGATIAPTPGTVFLCTHHTGAVDILALYPILRQFAGDLKIVVNEKLMTLKVLNGIFIPVGTPTSLKDNEPGRLQMTAHLQGGGNLLIYPAGKVGGKQNGRVQDSDWRHGGSQLIQENAKQVVLILVDAENSALFYLIRRFFSRLSLLLILRALQHRPKTPVKVYFGQPIPIEKIRELSPETMMRTLRQQTYRLKEIQNGN
jgi:putative hemolysin